MNKVRTAVQKHMLKRLLLLLCAYGCIGHASAQPYDPAKVNAKAATTFSNALDLLNQRREKEAIPLLEKCIQSDARFADAWLALGTLYGEQKQYERAIPNFESARNIDSVYFRDYSNSYSISLAGTGQFGKALDAINYFLSKPNLNERSRKQAEVRKRNYIFAIAIAEKNKNNPYVFAPRNLGDAVNSPEPEYFPSVTLDGGTLVFTRRVNHINEDFFASRFTNNQWLAAEALPGDINSRQNEGAQNIAQDGQWLVFTGCNFPNGYGSCDLYISVAGNNGWSTPQNLGEPVNSEAWDSQPCLSPDKRDLYFSSGRPGGYGGSDIYVSHRLPNGGWSMPENLGPTINTAGDENTPFIHADNQSLYFSSDRLQGYGGQDLFLVRRQPNGSWGAPENLGYPINTIDNESSLVIAADGKTAYFAADRSDSRGSLDIYTFELRSDVRPFKTTWVTGKVYDKKTKAGLPSLVELTDVSSKMVLSRLQTDASGNYLVTLPVGKTYAFNVNRKGYLLYSENFDLARGNDSVYRKDIPLQPIEVNASVVLRNIFFDTKKFELRPESAVELDKVVQLLNDNPTVRILISGHTDSIGKASDNLTLSNNRAKAVIAYLTGKGIAPQRLQFKGFGAARPVASNKTEAGRSQNRRTEMTVIAR